MKVWSCGLDHGTWLIAEDITSFCPCDKPAIPYEEYLKLILHTVESIPEEKK